MLNSKPNELWQVETRLYPYRNAKKKDNKLIALAEFQGIIKICIDSPVRLLLASDRAVSAFNFPIVEGMGPVDKGREAKVARFVNQRMRRPRFV